MGDVPSIVGVTALYGGLAGVVAIVLAVLLRDRSLRLTAVLVALIPVVVFAAAIVGTSRAMFLSGHDLKVVTIVCVAAGVIALALGAVVGAELARRSRDLQREARSFAESGTFARPAGAVPAELADLAAELERTSEHLARARERERLAEASRRELIGWVSHDLRTPLAGVRAMAEALEDGMVEDPERYHRQIRAEVERMGRMVDDLFELSRIQAGAFEVRPEQVALGDLVSEAIAGADPIARVRGVRLGGEVAQDTLVQADPAGMSRVLLNLITNAIRHTPHDGSVQIVGRTSPGAVELAVSDSCGGIPDHELARVFDVAWRGEQARPAYDDVGGVSIGAGAGLGLAIVKGIVEAHRGTVAVRNVGAGCRFVVRLPVPSGPI